MAIIQIDSDILKDLCMDRVNEFYAARAYPESFWKAVLDDLDQIGWLDPQYNSPSYIVDNIAVNGEYHTLEECYDNGILKEGEEPNPDWNKYGDYYCTGNTGL